MECMFCGMSAMQNHDVILNGGQNLYSCSMGEDYASLEEGGSDLIKSFDGIFNAQNVKVYPTQEQNSFCQGRGSVMLNGFTTE